MKLVRRTLCHGFTLIELIVVVIVLGILMAVVLGVFNGIGGTAKDSTAKQYLAVLYHACKTPDTQGASTWQDAQAFVDCATSSEPELTVTLGNCARGAAQTDPKVIIVDPASGSAIGMITYSHSQSGKTFRIWASNSHGPLTDEVGCGLTSGGNRIGQTARSVSPPTVTGTMREGGTLTVAWGDWDWQDGMAMRAQWISCSPTWTDCTNISGATDQSYAIQASDIGHTIGVIVTATDLTSRAPYEIVATKPGSTPGGGQGGDQGAGDGSGNGSGDTSGNGPVLPLAPTIGTNDQGQSQNPQIAPLPAASGHVLHLSNGTWHSTTTITSYGYQWYRCADAAGTTCVVIDGATDNTYTPNDTVAVAGGDGDVGRYLRAAVTAANIGGDNTAFSDPTNQVVGPPFAPSLQADQPTIGGSATEGVTLTGDRGQNWSGNYGTLNFDYTWQRCNANGNNCTTIPGATGTSHLLGAADLGYTIVFKVTATNAAGQVSAASDPTALVKAVAPVNTGLPLVSGIPHEGQTLTGTHGTWTSSLTPLNYTYQWYRCSAPGTCAPISGETNTTYVVHAVDDGNTLRLGVAASNPDATAVIVLSDPTDTVVALPNDNGSGTVAPSIGGTAQVGQTLTANRGTWTHGPTGYGYQWKHNGTVIPGATTSTYLVVTGDVGETITVTVTASNDAGQVSATSDPTAAVLVAAPVNSAMPTISGTAQVGQTLSATTGTWAPAATGYAYQWKHGGSAISGATSSTYVARASDVGMTLTVTVTASNPGGSATATSDPTVAVAGIPVNTGAPTISGTTKIGYTLSSTNGTWSPAATSYTRQWQRNGSDIPGATGSSYTETAADFGYTLRIGVVATNTSGSSTVAYSAASGTVTGDPPSVSASAQTVGESPFNWSWSVGANPLTTTYAFYVDGGAVTSSSTTTGASGSGSSGGGCGSAGGCGHSVQICASNAVQANVCQSAGATVYGTVSLSVSVGVSVNSPGNVHITWSGSVSGANPQGLVVNSCGWSSSRGGSGGGGGSGSINVGTPTAGSGTISVSCTASDGNSHGSGAAGWVSAN